MLKEIIINTIKKYNLIESGDKIILGVSGGPDSISMLKILNELKNEKKFIFDIVVCHINHGLRENAKLDEEYVQAFCEKHNIEYYVLHADIRKIAEKNKIGLEEAGRNIRYEFFNQIKEKTSANKIAIAHNSNDNAETIIMNMLRGVGLSGLKGIEAKNGIYIRPLIESERQEIEEYCEKENLNPRHDESNDENIYTRNKIRNIVIPYIKEEFNPNIIKTINRLSSIIKEDISFIENEVIKKYNEICLEEKNLFESDVYNEEKESTIILDLKKFNMLDISIQKRLILYSIEKIFGSTKGIEKIHIDDIIKLCNNNIGNKFLTPNKKTKIVIKNKKIYVMSVK